MGVLPSQSISELILKKIIFADKKIEKGQVQPASLDLRLGNVAWRIRASFLTGKDKNVFVKEIEDNIYSEIKKFI